MPLAQHEPWVAVSAASALDVQLLSFDVEQEIAASEFQTAWGETSDVPRLAFRMPPGGDATLSIRPRPSQTDVRVDVEYTIGRERLALNYHARAETSQGHAFQQRLTIPRGLAVREDGIATEFAVENGKGATQVRTGAGGVEFGPEQRSKGLALVAAPGAGQVGQQRHRFAAANVDDVAVDFQAWGAK